MNCLVTGASRGIGFAIAQRLAQAGYGVTLCSRNRDLLEERRAELDVVRDGQFHSVWPLDMVDLDAVMTAKNAPHCLSNYAAFVNSAGVASAALSLVQTADSIDNEIKVNLHAPILLSKVISRAMIKSKTKGRIVYVSSVLATKGGSGSAVYGATKAGIESYARALAREVGSRGIAVNCVAPGLVDTDMGRLANQELMKNNVLPGLIVPRAVADAVHFLLQAESITGTTLTVDNGCTA